MCSRVFLGSCGASRLADVWVVSIIWGSGVHTDSVS